MDIQKMWFQYKKIIVIAGIGIGLLSILGYLPEDLLGLGEYTVMAYGVATALSGFTFYKFYWNFSPKKPMAPKPQHEKYVMNRNLSNKRYTDDVLRAQGIDPRKVGRDDDQFIVPPEEKNVRNEPRRKDSDVFERFKTE